MAASNHAMRGFSLVELMIVVVIIGIIASVAIPYFGEAGMRGKRVEAKEILLKAASKQEQFFAQYVSYTNVIKGTSTCSGVACGLGLEDDLSENENYKLSITVGPVGCQAGSDTAPMCRTYTLTATPEGGFNDSECQALTYTNAGVRGVKNVTNQTKIKKCWR
ncbi:type IV pilin protein [Pseudoteredinibacter isoporae]|uniref:Type IV pilus assembly protein PilE n=1 Tax=Pseudoteredinibacter isoporae TaxID=570281 RepID=A0A7X0JSL1_9GAMM|nr:type IV pilin protein [Pseudoteredinibacter isoporae]MBB6520913.1 type IV pilus assembly protein PilE [Pseudoteredinibacter isoporae]NHO86478.1 prepilin-type N-terminal cleavage/methylation domain-containing protein [Pseudoteredinibacter isoporae]NIB25070.1 prepilin-type N-terminal cleavage/methylation domain-containing protein [Pseudoteredinibacter isoporae]